jgi:nucleoside-diphosphate-sugar epimerase
MRQPLYHVNYGLDTVSLRYFSVYGPRQRPDMAFTIFARALIHGEPIRLFGGDQTRDFTFVDDVVAATRRVGEGAGPAGAKLNIGGGSRLSLREAVAARARERARGGGRADRDEARRRA